MATIKHGRPSIGPGLFAPRSPLRIDMFILSMFQNSISFFTLGKQPNYILSRIDTQKQL